MWLTEEEFAEMLATYWENQEDAQAMELKGSDASSHRAFTIGCVLQDIFARDQPRAVGMPALEEKGERVEAVRTRPEASLQ